MSALPALGRAGVALQKIEAMGLSLAARAVENSSGGGRLARAVTKV